MISSETGTETTWTEEAVREFLASEKLAYQSISLPYNLSTPGAKRDDICRLAFGHGVDGKFVLDIGSYLGYFCLEALERGAASATGIEVDPDKIRQANIIADIKGLKPHYILGDIEKDDVPGRFDIVLCLNVLHHMFDPVGVIRKLAHATRETLIIEAASLNPRDSRKLRIGFLQRLMISRLPVIFVSHGEPNLRRKTSVQKFFFTSGAITNLLMRQTKLFSRVEVVPSSFKKRFIIRATRRRIDHLLIVSGPTSSGKSTFLRRLRSGGLPGEIMELLPQGCGDWRQVGASKLSLTPPRDIDGKPLDDDHYRGLVLHYDFMRPYVSGSQAYHRDQALDLIACADKVTVMVLKPGKERLISQLEESELKSAAGGALARHGRNMILRSGWVVRLLDKAGRIVGRRLAPKDRRRYEELLESYKSEGWLEERYRRWHAYLADAHHDMRIETIAWPADGKQKSGENG